MRPKRFLGKSVAGIIKISSPAVYATNVYNAHGIKSPAEAGTSSILRLKFLSEEAELFLQYQFDIQIKTCKVLSTS